MFNYQGNASATFFGTAYYFFGDFYNGERQQLERVDQRAHRRAVPGERGLEPELGGSSPPARSPRDHDPGAAELFLQPAAQRAGADSVQQPDRFRIVERAPRPARPQRHLACSSSTTTCGTPPASTGSTRRPVISTRRCSAAPSWSSSPACSTSRPEFRKSGKRRDLADRERLDPRIERVTLAAGIDDEQPLEAKVLERDPHRTRGARRLGVFDLEPVAPAVPHEQQVEFGAAVRGPEAGGRGESGPQGSARSRSPRRRLRPSDARPSAPSEGTASSAWSIPLSRT